MTRQNIAFFCCSAENHQNNNCSDYRIESNGVFVLGVVFFLQTKFDFYLAIFDGICFLYHSKGIVVLSLNLKFFFLPVIKIFQVMGS